MTAASPALPPSPLDEGRKVLLARLVDGLDAPSLWWLSGYTAGLAQVQAAPQLAVLPGGGAAAAPQAGQRLTVLYGSQTGNARREAEKLAQAAEAAGLAVRLVRTDSYPTRELASERLLYIVISTQGEGDPPDDAIGFTEFLSGKRAPKLPELRYAVLGLGDTSYADFAWPSWAPSGSTTWARRTWISTPSRHPGARRRWPRPASCCARPRPRPPTWPL
jgi:sulfite reductase (NADPH) flavoprotein alpha-component